MRGGSVVQLLVFAAFTALCLLADRTVRALFRVLRENRGGRFWCLGGKQEGQRWILWMLPVCFALGILRMGVEMRPALLERVLEQQEKECLPVSAKGRLKEKSVKNGMVTLVLGDVEILVKAPMGGVLGEDAGEASGEIFTLPRVMISVKAGLVNGDETGASAGERGGGDADRGDFDSGEYGGGVSGGRSGSLLPGMLLQISGDAELFDGPHNPGEFDYRLYCRSKKLRVRIRADAVRITDQRVSPNQKLTELVRTQVTEILELLCSPEDAGIYQALLLGDQTRIPEELRKLYQKSGIAHLLAVSGLHMSLIGMGLYGVFRRFGLGYSRSGLLSGAVLLFYGGLTGFGPSVVRALIMIFCSFTASHLGRTYDLLSAMALSLFLLVFDAPYQLFAGGVQLSFAAVASVGCGNELERLRRLQLQARRQEEKAGAEEAERAEKADRNTLVNLKTGIGASVMKKLAGALWISLCIQIGTYPILLYHFFEFPVYGLLLNLVVLPLMAYVVGSGLCAVSLGVLARAAVAVGISHIYAGTAVIRFLGMAARASVGPGHYLLSGYRWLCEGSLRLPFHTLTAGRPPLGRIVLYYLIIGLILGWGILRRVFDEAWGIKYGRSQSGISDQNHMRSKISGRKRRLYSGGLLVFCILLLAVRPVSGLEVDVLDVGQGDGIFLETRELKLLVDSGSSQLKSLGANRLTPFLRSRGVSRLDYVFVTHGDLDHVSGIRYLLEEGEIAVDRLVFSCLSREDETCEELAELQRGRGGQVFYMKAGQAISGKKHRRGKNDDGTLHLKCLYPSQDNTASDKNDQSLVLLAAYGDFSILLTGDLEIEGEEQMLNLFPERPPGKIMVLKAGHHGSKSSTSEELLYWLRPQAAILSYGEGNSYGHPSKEVVERLENLDITMWNTADSGMISVRTDGKKASITGFKE